MIKKKKAAAKSPKGKPASRSKKSKNPQGFQKGRGHPDAVLTEQKVMDLRAGKFEHMTQRELAEKWGVSAAALSFARTGASWTHLPNKQKPRPRGVRAGTGAKKAAGKKRAAKK